VWVFSVAVLILDEGFGFSVLRLRVEGLVFLVLRFRGEGCTGHGFRV
jgi:hypothetical protein